MAGSEYSRSGTSEGQMRAALEALLVLVMEETYLWSFDARIETQHSRLDVGWPFTSWALSEWIRLGWVDFISRDTWTSQSRAAPSWNSRTRAEGEWIVLDRDGALALANDIGRWRGDIDSLVQATPSPSAPPDDDQWIDALVESTTAPPLGPDVVSRAEARKRSAMSAADLLRGIDESVTHEEF
ncbi:hypothetical protein ACEXQD_03175 [Herbiconiux sp. P15]|uniref:hypothetical protein n=1 Tax=Herbiconiux liukaitaii TaxID=3342799 RepID=UPI0035B77F6F